MVSQIYHSELQLNKANASDTGAAFLDLHLSISNDIVSIGILGQVWYLIVSIPDLCTLTYFLLSVIELDLYFLIIYQCMKYESNTPMYSKDIARKPLFLGDIHTGRDGYMPPHPPLKMAGA